MKLDLSLKLNNASKQILGILGLLVVFIISLMLFVSPQYNQLRSALAAKKDLQSQLQITDEQMESLEQLAGTIDKLEEEDKIKVAKAVPYNEDLEGFLVDIHRLAQQSGLVITDFDVKPNTAQIDEVGGPSQIQKSQLNISLRGTYTNIYSFFTMLERYVRPINVLSFSITDTSGSILHTPGQNNNLLQADIAGEIYHINPAPAIPLFPFGIELDTTLLKSAQFKALQLIGSNTPSKPSIDPFIYQN